jgi:hypothetical protein
MIRHDQPPAEHVCGMWRIASRNDIVRHESTISQRLTTETVQSAALSLQGVDDVQRGDSLALGVLSVGDSITDDALKEGLEDSAGLLVDDCSQDESVSC